VNRKDQELGQYYAGTPTSSDTPLPSTRLMSCLRGFDMFWFGADSFVYALHELVRPHREICTRQSPPNGRASVSMISFFPCLFS
jgi:hypothetical protein